MIKDKGIRSLLPPVTTDDDIREQAQARAAVMRRLNVKPNELQAADNLSTSDINFLTKIPAPIIPKIKPKKLSDHDIVFASMTPKEAMEFTGGKDKEKIKFLRDVKAKQRAIENYEKEADIISPTLFQDTLPKKIPDTLPKNKIKKPYYLYNPVKNELEDVNHPDFNKKANDGVKYKNAFERIEERKKEQLSDAVVLDPKHPDGFRLTDDKDLYKNYGDTPVRYIQEIVYKYENDAPVPVENVVKKFDSNDRDTYPSNPAQKKALDKYQQVYNKLSPSQRKQLETAKKAKI